MAPSIFTTFPSHTSLLAIADATKEEQEVSVGFLAVLYFALSGYKVTCLCNKERIEKEFEAILSCLSNPRCVEALRNVVFLYLADVDDFLQVCIKAPMFCLSESVVVIPDLLEHFCLETCDESSQKVLQGLALLNMFTKEQNTVKEEEKSGLQAAKGKPSFFICFCPKSITSQIILKLLFDEEISLTAEHRKCLWQEMQNCVIRE